MSSDTLPKWLQPGVRKIVVLGIPMAFVIVASTVALFSGKMTAVEWGGFVLDTLRWGGGIFAVANVLEHFSKLPAKALAKP